MTVNIEDKDGKGIMMAINAGYHAWHENGITTIETRASDEAEARRIASQFGKILYIW